MTAMTVLSISRTLSGANGRAIAFPLPLAGEGQGGGRHKDSRKHALSPPLPRKREREQTEFAALTVSLCIEGAAFVTRSEHYRSRR
jgi:hypothetical protein